MLALKGGGPRWVEWILLSPLPWFGMFAAGAMAQRYRERIVPMLKGRLLQMLALYCALAALSKNVPLYPLLRADGNAMGVLNFIALCPLILSAAYAAPHIGDRLLQRNDISYGIYLFHGPVINLVIYSGLSGAQGYLVVLCVTLLLAVLSWTLLEKKCLSLRGHPMFSRNKI